ncbi:prostate-associated microseminoprotein [Brienomyrus brachyistius]|uniref:prostate-associated microseminoprotein n=1 Tax=Brienomyrus brachyistius TaxID=42636 RepID=UPI0020B29D11|nr:prostate-associated microseminoprotein [Brienomyrus brachyistius]
MRAKQMGLEVLAVAVCMLSTAVAAPSVYSSGECYFNTKASCEYRGQVFRMGESWTNKECYLCVCMEPFGVGCCDQDAQPVDYPDWCEVVQKPDSCTTAVVMRANHKLPCLHGRRGRLRPGTAQAWKSDNDPLF